LVLLGAVRNPTRELFFVVDLEREIAGADEDNFGEVVTEPDFSDSKLDITVNDSSESELSL